MPSSWGASRLLALTFGAAFLMSTTQAQVKQDAINVFEQMPDCAVRQELHIAQCDVAY